MVDPWWLTQGLGLQREPSEEALENLILGIGNELLGDEGIGIHVVRALAQKDLPAGTHLAEIGTSLLDAIPLIGDAERMIVVDAMKAGGSPGTVYCLPLKDCAVNPCIASLHGFDITRILALAENTMSPECAVVGIEPAVIDWSLELSPDVLRSIPYAVRAVREILLEKRSSCASTKGRVPRFFY